MQLIADPSMICMLKIWRKYMHCEKYMHTFSIIHRFSVMRHIKEMKQCDISGHQMGYIIHIHKNPGSSQEEIADFFKLNKGTVAKGLKRLMENGYIIKKQNEQDRRAYELYLTEKGKGVLAEANTSLLQFNEILTRGMSAEETETFEKLLNRACANVLEAAGEEKDELMRPGPPPGAPDCCCGEENLSAAQGKDSASVHKKENI